ncbi:MAG: CoA transferase [Mesorhizobium sp.]
MASENEFLPLDKVKVVEFCQVAAGPFCGMLLADFGADVIKIENPQSGDSLRSWPPITNGFSENFASLNRNKRSVALDLKDVGQRAIALQLCAQADVVVENNRPGVMKRLGLGYDDIKAVNPAIVYCSISGFGQTGPRAADGGFDVTIQAIAGVMSVTGEPDGGPVKCGVPISDFSTGLYAAFSIASAIPQARTNGVGTHIDVSLLGATLGVSALQTSEYFGTGKAPKRLGSAHPRNAPYQAFQASDDWFVMAAGNNKLWTDVCRIVGLPELVDDPRFVTNDDRARNQIELKDILEAVFAAKPATDWIDAFQQAGVPCSPINTFASALDDKQVEFMEWIREISLPDGTRTRTFASPVRFNGKGLGILRNPPALGEHNDEVIGALSADIKTSNVA